MKTKTHHEHGMPRSWYGLHLHETSVEGSVPGSVRFRAGINYSLWGTNYGTVKYTSSFFVDIRLAFSPFEFKFGVHVFRTHFSVWFSGLHLKSLQPAPTADWLDYSDYPAEPSDRLNYLDAKLTKVLRNTEYTERTKALTVVYEHFVDIPRSQVDRHKYVELVQLLNVSLRESTAS